MSVITFNPVTYNSLSFTNVDVTETDTGVITPFTTALPQLAELNTANGVTLQWGAFNIGVYGANSSEVLNFNYTVTDTSSTSLIDSVGQLYAADFISGPGVSLTAVENVYNTAGILIGTETFTGGQPNLSAIQLTQAVQAVNVSITVTMSVNATGTNASAVGISEIQQSFGTIASTATASIGNTVFYDVNDTGLETSPVAGAVGVTVELLNSTGTSVLETTTTTTGGQYNFTGLAAGVYEVKFVAPTGYGFSPEGVGSNPAINSSANQTTGITAQITLTAGEIDNNVEAGLVAGSAGTGTATIGNTVWMDTNANGLDDGEKGVAGVTVDLLNGTGTSILASTTTDSTGTYQFTNLTAGTYEVQFVAPTGDSFTTQNVNPGTTGDINSVVGSSGLSAPIILTTGEVDNNVNAGLTTTKAAIGDFVWQDTNGNGLQDTNETGVAGVKVSLLAADTLTLKISEDYYLANAQYTVTVNGVQIGGTYTASASHAAGADTLLTLNGDFGNNPTVVVNFLNDAYAGTASTDRNLYVDGITYNGVNENESAALYSAGAQSFAVTGAGGSVLATTTTDSTGAYHFTNLNAGVYEVAFTAPTGAAFTTQYAGTNPAIDSNANQSGITGPVTLAAGQTDNTIDAGLVATCAIGDFVWQDLNRNGIQNTGEPGVGGVKVSLLAADTLVLKISEDYYLANAQYTVTVNGVQVGGTYTASASHAAGADTLVTLNGDFGTNPTVTVNFLNDAYAGTASTDRNLYVDGITYNGINENQSATLLSNGPQTFALTGAGGSVLATTTTNSAGYYSFTGLNPGNYEVAFAAPTGETFTTQYAGTNTALDSNANQATGVTGVVNLTAGQTDNTIDAGLVNSSGISVLKQPCTMVVNQCGQVTYTFSVTNTGTTALTNVKITDNIGSATNPDNVTPTLVTTGTNGILGAGQTWVYTETVSQINCTQGGSGSVCHTASGGNLSAGCTAWLHSSFNPTSCADGATYKFQGVTCTISGGGVGSNPIKVTCPDSEVIFSKNCYQATTIFNASTNCWVTTLPANCNPGSVFLTGCPLTIPSGCSLTNSNVTWSVGDSSNNCGASSLNWDGGCTGYQTFNANGCNGTADYNQIGVKSCDNQSGYGNGGSCNVGYGYNGSNYCNIGYNGYGGGCGSTWNNTGWIGSGSDNCGTPENQFTSSNCGNTSSCNNNSYSNSCGTSNTATQNCTNIAGAADTVTVTAQAVTGTSCTTTASGGSHLTSGCTAWLSSTFKPTSCANGATYNFTGVTCRISGSGVGSSPITVNCPNATVTFSSSCTTATTVFNASTNCWVTTLPANCNPGNVFLSGCPQTIANGCDLTNAQVTWSIGGSTNNCGASSLNWDGTCTGYSSFNQNNYNGSTNYNQIGVKACDNLGSATNGASSAGAPCTQYSSSNCGNTVACTNSDNDTNTCGTTSTTVTSTGVTVTASDTKEVQVLGCNSNISVNGTAPTGSLSALYGTAQTLEFTYNPGSTVTLQQVQAGLGTVSGSTPSTLAFMEISNNANPFASGATIYFEGEVTSGEKIYADATTNVLTNTPIAGGHFSTTAGADIFAYVFTSQQAFQSGAAPVQTMAYNTSGSQAMHIGDTIGSLSVVGFVGATGGHLAS